MALGVLLIGCALGGPAACADKTTGPRQITDADPGRGLQVIEKAGCGACHSVPGLRWPAGSMAAPLDGFGNSPMIAGRLPNQPEVLIRFVQDAPSLDPDSPMPAMPISDAEARDVAAYLYTLR